MECHQEAQVKSTSASPPANAQEIVDRANELSILDLNNHIENEQRSWFLSRFQLVLTICDASTITMGDLDRCFLLVKDNLQTFYEHSSWGWDEDAKRQELKEPGTKYILLHPAREHVSTEGPVDEGFGFLSCQIVVEDDEPVIYCYELQLCKALQGLGLGSRLMTIMHSLAERLCMTRAFLTVFTDNELACKFYEKLGYTRHKSSPRDRTLRGRKVRADYRILSKKLKCYMPCLMPCALVKPRRCFCEACVMYARTRP